MKKLLTIFALLCMSAVGWADTQYCDHEITGVNHGHKMSVTYESLGNNQYTLIMTSEDAFSSYNSGGSNFYTEVNGVGGTQVSANLVQNGNTLTFTVTSNPKPNVYVGDFYVNYSDGEEHYNIPTDEDWTATCGGGSSCTDEVAPTVSAVSVGSITYNSAVLTITASDNVAVTRYVVKNGSTQIGAGTSNEITLTGLSSGTTYHNISVYAYDACNNESSAFSVDEFTTDNISYCRYATGHLGNPEFGDIYGRILLTIKKVDNSTIGVKVEPNNNGSKGIKYLNIIVNGVNHEYGNNDGSGDDLTGYFNISGLASLDFTFNLFFYCNTPNWTTQQFSVTENQLCDESPVVLSEGSEYCGDYGVECERKNGAYAYLKWETNEDGDVVITMVDGNGSTNARFRGNNGMGENLNGFTVLSGNNFATSEAASTYFTRVYVANGNTFKLQRKGGAVLPSPAKIRFASPALEWSCTQDGDGYAWPTYEYTYGKTCAVVSGYAVSASVNDAAMGTATAKVGDEDVTHVDAGTTVRFTATANDTYTFVNWTKNDAVVSTNPVYDLEINENTYLTANFDYVRTTYCHKAVQTNGNKKVYLTVGKGATDGTYQIKIEGSDELTITGINNANTAINRVKYLTYDGNDVPLTVANGGWTYSNEGYGVITSAEIRPQTGYTWRDMWMWRPDLYMGTSSGEQVINDILDNQHHFNWDNDCSDTEAPEWITCSAAALTSTSVRLTLQASDNFDGTLTYIIARQGEDNIVLEGASGEMVTRDITGLTSGTEYTFNVIVSDGVNATAARSLTVTPSGDTQAPVITSFTATPSYGHIDLAITATDDVAGDLTYTIAYGETEESVVGAAGSEVTKRIFALPNTSISFRVTATDAADHVSAVATASARTLAVPASPKPIHNEGLVRSVYSDEYTAAVVPNFWRRNFGGAELIAESDYMLYRMNANVIVWGNADENAGHGNIDGLDGYTYGSNPGLNVSQMQYLHFDVWCDVAGQLNTVNINDQTISIPTTRTIAGEWVSFDVAIDGVNEADRQNLRWMKFHPFNTSNCHVAIDNVYFWNYGVKTTIDEDGYGWASFASAEKVKFSADITGYFAEYQNNGDGEVLLLHEITDRIIPAGEGVLLRGTGNAAFAFSTTDETPATDFTNNTLEGCTERTDISDLHANYDIFCLRRSDLYEMSGFFLYTGQYIPAGKAFLKLAKDPAVPASSRRVRFVFDQENTATGVDNAENAVKASKCIENGQLYIIRDGLRYTATGLRVE